ncbi:MAG: D-alanyl-D-alanine carboxypeptidase [Oscillospiraceae bacterium]|nr:D-alanyl-D-alanine carboxypeptidase [Oscillospiraceae bacterium]
MAFCLSTEIFAAPKGAVLIDKNSKRIFFEINKDKPLPMASTTKIMTAVITLEQENLDEYFTVDGNAIMVEGSSMGLKKGDRVTLRILAKGMLLASGNDAANAAAVRISGSTEAFIELMNQRAKEMGLESTSFETPSGLDGENHFSTAYDMAILAKNALENPDFAAICSEKSVTIEYGNPPYSRRITNHNKLLNTLDGVTGVKTGFTKKAGRCLVSSAERDGVSLICVTLGCPDDWNYHKNLYEEYFKKLSSVPLEEDIPEIKIPVVGGEEAFIILKALPVSAALFDGEKEKIEVIISKEPFVFAPFDENEIFGKVIFKLDGETVAETPLVTEKSVSLKQSEKFFDKIKNIFN